MRDLIYACRTLRRSAWYSATVVAVLAAGLALATVVFAIVDGVLFKPLPYSRVSELILIRAFGSTPQGPRLSPVSLRDVRAWIDAIPELRTTVVSHTAMLSERSEGREYWSAGIDEHFFDVLGTRPMLGGFSSEDFDYLDGVDRSKARWTPILVSHRYWRSVLHEDLTAIGRNTPVSEREGQTFGYRVTGVLPPGFVFPVDAAEPQPDILRPIPRAGLAGRREYQLLARIAPDVQRVSLAERLVGVARRLATEPRADGHHPDQPADRVAFDGVRLVSLEEHLGSRERQAFGLVLAAAAVLVLLTGVNVAGLATARNIERRHETTVRRALGAGPRHLIVGVLAEVVLLGAAGTALALSRPLLAWTLALLPAGITLLKEPALDGRVFGAVGLLTIATVALVALWPARVALSGRGIPSGSAETVTRRLRRSGRVLIGSQIALGFVLVAAGALTIASLAAAWRTDPGYRRDRMLLFEVFASRHVSSADAVEQLNSARNTARHQVISCACWCWSNARPSAPASSRERWSVHGRCGSSRRSSTTSGRTISASGSPLPRRLRQSR